MSKKSSMTGTGKKAHKQEQKALKKQAELYQQYAPGEAKGRKSALHRIEQFGKGRHLPEYKGKTEYKPFDYKAKTKYEPSKFKPKTEYNPTNFKPKTEYEHSTLGKLQKDFARAGEGLEPLFEKRLQAAQANFSQNVAPQIANAAGSSDSSKSSAVRQAIAGAQANLNRNLSADFEAMRNNIAGNLLGTREQQKQFSAEFGAGQEQFGANLRANERQYASQFGAGQEQYYDRLRAQQEQYKSQFGVAQEQFGADLRNQQNQYASQFGLTQEGNIYNSQLQSLQAKLNANQLLMGNPVNTGFTPLQSPYRQQESNKQPTFGERYVNSLKGGAVGAGTGFLVGGPVGAGVGGGIGGFQGFMG